MFLEFLQACLEARDVKMPKTNGFLRASVKSEKQFDQRFADMNYG